MENSITLVEIILRLFLSVMIAGVIGFDREHKNRPAGIKTHALVCAGACLIALLQKQIGFDALQLAILRPELSGILRADEARLIAQVVSGIGFLGAGTILVNHRVVLGLTTAASLWAVAGIGLSFGMGYYNIGLVGALFVILVLVFSKKIIRVNTIKKLEIKYRHKFETKEFIQKYFENKGIIVSDVNFKVTQDADKIIYVNVYEIEIPRDLNYASIIEDISMNKNIMCIQMISI